MVGYALRLGVGAVIRRLGFLLEVSGVDAPKELKRLRSELTASYHLLDPTLPPEGRRVSRWKLRLNVGVDEIQAAQGNLNHDLPAQPVRAVQSVAPHQHPQNLRRRPATYDPRRRAAAKKKQREEDARRLKAGEVSARDLRTENSFLPLGSGFSIVRTGGPPLKRRR
jgi:hypothetical protein